MITSGWYKYWIAVPGNLSLLLREKNRGNKCRNTTGSCSLTVSLLADIVSLFGGGAGT
jgi:hypothetical protein